jgi:hypothetical protein
MDATATQWVLGIVITVLIGVAVGLYLHVKDDAKVHERVATLEERTNTQGGEIKSLREMRHEIIEHCSQALAEWYTKVVEMIGRMK